MKQKTEWKEARDAPDQSYWISLYSPPKGFFAMGGDVRWVNVWGRGVVNRLLPSLFKKRKIIGDPD